jgi:hypothetical protein
MTKLMEIYLKDYEELLLVGHLEEIDLLMFAAEMFLCVDLRTCRADVAERGIVGVLGYANDDGFCLVCCYLRSVHND